MRYKRGGEERKGGRERPNEWLGRVNGWRVTRMLSVEGSDRHDGMALKSLGASWMLVRSHMGVLCDFGGATSHDFIYL